MRLIDADALKERLKEYCIDGDEQAMLWYDLMGIDETIDDAPTIEDKPVRRGHWLYTEAWPHRVYCSVCFRTYALKHWQIWEAGSLARAYCPNCGAKMDGGDENE